MEATDDIETSYHIFACTGPKCALSSASVSVLRANRPLPVTQVHQDNMKINSKSPIFKEVFYDLEPFQEDFSKLHDNDEHVKELMKKYEQQKQELLETEGTGGEEQEVADDPVDKVMMKFNRRMTLAPSQCVRFCANMHSREQTQRAVSPLWICSKGRMAGQPPPCQLCGSPRRFEFQLMPQILNFLEVEETKGKGPNKHDNVLWDFDWGIIAVYVCSKHCKVLSEEGSGYSEEFAYRQPGVDSHMTGNMNGLLKA